VKRNKNIGKVLFQFEKTALLILSLIVFVNITVNLLIYLLMDSLAFTFFIEQIVMNLFIFALIYVMLYSIIQGITAVPFMVSLNSPREILGRKIIIKGINRGFIISLVSILIKVLLNMMGIYSVSSIIGISFSSNSIADVVLFALSIFLIVSIIYSFITFISLVGMKFGWEYVLTIIFIFLGTGFFLVRSIVLLFVFGWRLDMFIFLLIFFHTGFSVINYKLIKDFEYKY